MSVAVLAAIVLLGAGPMLAAGAGWWWGKRIWDRERRRFAQEHAGEVLFLWSTGGAHDLIVNNVLPVLPEWVQPSPVGGGRATRERFGPSRARLLRRREWRLLPALVLVQEGGLRLVPVGEVLHDLRDRAARSAEVRELVAARLQPFLEALPRAIPAAVGGPTTPAATRPLAGL